MAHGSQKLLMQFLLDEPGTAMLTSLWMQNEVKLLLELLPKYSAHVEKHPHTLLVKFFGLYRVVPESGSKVGIKLHANLLFWDAFKKRLWSLLVALHILCGLWDWHPCLVPAPPPTHAAGLS